MRDAHGAPLHVGDYVGYITGGRNPETFIGQILEIRSKIKVKLTNERRGTAPDGTRWIHSWRATRTLTLEEFDRIDKPAKDEYSGEHNVYEDGVRGRIGYYKRLSDMESVFGPYPHLPYAAYNAVGRNVGYYGSPKESEEMIRGSFRYIQARKANMDG